MVQRLFIDIRPIIDNSGEQDASDILELDKLEVEMIIVLGRHRMPPEVVPEGYEGPVVHAYSTAFEFLELLNNIIRGDSGTAELVPLEHFLAMEPFDHDRVKIHFQYNITVVPDENQTPSFIVPFEELAREIILFTIGVYETLIEIRPDIESELDTLNATIEETKRAAEEYFRIEELLTLSPEEENVEDG